MCASAVDEVGEHLELIGTAAQEDGREARLLPLREVVANLAVWYDVRMDGEEGEKWLKDLRQWWRRAGRSLDMPVDGVSAATRPPGTHSMQFRGDRGLIAGLPPGRYTLVVEAAREVGGREVLQLPFDWPPTATVTDQAEGERELGSVRLELLP